jgi:Bacterial protein of unknown function (DUF885)
MRSQLFFLLLAVIPVFAGNNSGAPDTPPAWVERSNNNAQVLLEVLARFNPEVAARLGVEGLDEEVADLRRGITERTDSALQEAVRTLSARLEREAEEPVRQDLEILINSANDNIRGNRLSEKYLLPYFNISQIVFGGLRALLDEQIPAKRRASALVRLKRYTGLEKGFSPIGTLAMDRTRERLKTPDLLGPSRAEVEKDLENIPFFESGIGKLFEQYKITGYEEAYEELKRQFTSYAEFVRTEVLPRAREDFRLPEELYAENLRQYGVDIPPDSLARMARAAFADIQRQMQELAEIVARNKGWKEKDYRDVIRRLKQDQLVGDAILPFYRKRVHEIEDIIRRENLVTLPEREMRIRIASEAESAQQPAPHMRPPRLIGNTGEMGEFVLPLNIPAADSAKSLRYDDFTFAAASWTLTAHEGRPGHEMQFSSIIEKGVSAARAIFAFNSVNVEGWGLYSEAILLPFLPPEGKLISLQHRLLRAARAFIDPGLQAGTLSVEEASRILREDGVLSEAMTNQEIERYTFRAPGQATSYYYGFTRLMELRHDVENQLGKRFDQRRFHDFVLAQGLLPPNLVRRAVLHEFGLSR